MDTLPLLVTVAFVMVCICTLYLFRSKGRRVIWEQLRRQYDKQFPEILPNDPLGAGIGSIASQRFSYLAVNAVKSGICIQKMLPPFNIFFRPIYLPWSSLARIVVEVKARTKMKNQKHHVQARLFLWDSKNYSISIPWRKEFETIVPASVIIEDFHSEP